MDECHYDQGSTTWNYDSRGHVTTELKTIGTQSFTTHWGYNSADQVTTTTYPDGEVVTNEFDSRMLLNSVTGTNPYVSSTTYDSAGRIDVQTFGNNTKTDHDYFSWNTQGGRLEVLKSGTTDNPVSLQNITYSYGPRGNILQMTDALANETNSFGYDALSRLISWSLNGTTETYEYNATTGNLETKAGISLQYNDAAHPHAVTDAGGNSYTYGPNGNQATRIIGGQTYTLGYDAENRLVSVSGAVTASFVYDGDGNRVKSTINGVTTTFVGNWYEVTGSQITKYYFAGTQRVAMRKYIIPQPDTLTYLFGDQLGSTSLAVDASSGEVVETRYKPWGEVRYTTPDKTLPTRYTFTGQYSDSYINLLWYGSRHYDPELGRFIQPDSIVPLASQGVQAYDRYAYGNNNPVRFSDPSGHRICDYDCQIEYEGADPAYKHYGESLSCWGPQECWGIKPNTVVSKALGGDTGALVDALVPTTYGIRGQGEFVLKNKLNIFGVPIPLSITAGGQIVFNRNDGDLSMNIDVAPEVGPAFMPDPLLFGASATGGPELGWFSSDAQQVTTGDSAVLSGTLAGGDAYSVSIVTLPPGTLPDTKYGVKPVTIYGGEGVGGGYASIGTGISRSLWQYSINIYDLFR